MRTTQGYAALRTTTRGRATLGYARLRSEKHVPAALHKGRNCETALQRAPAPHKPATQSACPPKGLRRAREACVAAKCLPLAPGQRPRQARRQRKNQRRRGAQSAASRGKGAKRASSAEPPAAAARRRAERAEGDRGGPRGAESRKALLDAEKPLVAR